MDRLIIVTTEKFADSQTLANAARWSTELGCRLETDKQKVRELQEEHEGRQDLLVIMVGREQTKLFVDGRSFFYHPNMAKLRLQSLLRGQTDQFILATGLQAGKSLLDCTLGLGADAIVASHVAGPTGRVVGLECMSVLGMLVKEGLSNYTGIKGNRQNPALQQCLISAMRNVSAKIADSYDYLTKLSDGSFDVVYFDPMFRHTREQSSSIDLLRLLGSKRPLDGLLLEQAVRVASKKVVVKERRGSQVFAELGITSVIGGKYSSVAYGVIEK